VQLAFEETMMAKKYDVTNLSLAKEGRDRILWADRDMPVLAKIREEFEKKKPLKGITLSACLHVTSETANLVRALKDGGAEVFLCASNPLSTQDDTAAALVKHFGISVFARRGEDRKTFYSHLNAVLDAKPNITMDDGADLVNLLHHERKEAAGRVIASMEETTTGVIRLRAMEAAGKLKFPVIAVNDADTKHLFDNRYGTGQSTLDGVLRATNKLFAGLKFVVVGYGWCGRGVAMRAKGAGARVIVTEINPIRALEATMDGFDVMPMSQAAVEGDVFVTLTGNKHVLRPEHFKKMKDGAILCNSGHFDVEIDLPGLKKLASKVNKQVRPLVDESILPKGKRLYVLAEGRLVNLACATGHPASVMDMSFATQGLCAPYAVKKGKGLGKVVNPVPIEIEQRVSTLKLLSMGIKIDTLTPEQVKYLASYEEGT
jgi:adenosylhomocysteinase